ncbi:hypothetical protein F5Y11DRAFT_302252 [Daldinia sp. FL1419]|nr:hypothetical protein F5Y11DRAFT_302252 [Daldinia sp. FL1419]
MISFRLLPSAAMAVFSHTYHETCITARSDIFVVWCLGYRVSDAKNTGRHICPFEMTAMLTIEKLEDGMQLLSGILIYLGLGLTLYGLSILWNIM